MPTKTEDTESQIIKQMFDEIIKMIGQKQIKLESIIQKMTEQGSISQESFERVNKLLTEYAKKKQWV